MDGPEARALARRFELDLPEDVAQRLVTQTAGWPALLALATAAVRRTGDLRLAATGGSSVADYLRSEVLQPQPASVSEFMIRTSILERLSGPLCDAVLERDGSAAVLEELARSTLLVDDYAGWFRYHPILRRFLQHELDVREPGLAAELHRRASTWHESVGDEDHAVEHAFSSGDLDLAARTVARAFLRLHWAGRRTTLRGWIQRFEETDLSRAALAGPSRRLPGDVRGECGRGERLADLAERGTYQGPPPDGTASIESGRAMVRALQARHGAAAMLADATLAADLEGSGSPWRGFALWILALLQVRERGHPRLRRGPRGGDRRGPSERRRRLHLRHAGPLRLSGDGSRGVGRSGGVHAGSGCLGRGRTLRWLPVLCPGARGGHPPAASSW